MRRLSALLLGAATMITLATSAATPALAVEKQSHGDGGFSSLPAAARATVSGALGRDSLAFRASANPAGFRMHNRLHGLTADFGRRGVVVRADGGRTQLSLRSLGYGSRLSPVTPAQPRATRNRIEYRRGALSEWYVNGPLGLEQGFTLARRPSTRASGPLTLALRLTGSLRPSLATGAKDIDFFLMGRPASIRYSGLAVWDATGRELPARLVLRGSTLFIRIEDPDARYPLTIDPTFQQAKLTASDGAEFDMFGKRVAISGDVIVVGAADDEIGAAFSRGSAYVFVKPGGGWATATQTAKLTASDGVDSDFFGASVAISGDTIVVGANGDDVGGVDERGSAYVFVKPGGGWVNATQTAKLTASDAAAGDSLGVSVGISGNTVIAGAFQDQIGMASSQGSAYIYVKPAGPWVNATQTAKLTSSNGEDFDFFGESVSISGDTAVVGARFGNGVAANTGAAYVYVKPAGPWANGTETAKLSASDGVAGDAFGGSVSIDGDTVAAGASADQVGGNVGQGSAFVFVKPGAGWVTGTQTARLNSSGGGEGDTFGSSVSVSGDTIVVGASSDDVGSGDEGAAYVFVKPGGGWTSVPESAQLAASDGELGDTFGESVSISGTVAVVGASGDDIGSLINRGSAYVFTITAAPSPGELRVTTNPAVASQVLIDGAIRNSWGLDWLNLNPGTYTLGFAHVEGFTEPAPQQVTVNAGQTTTVNANFTQRGSLRVITSPAVPGTISVDGVPRNNWGLWTDVPAGNHQVCFGAVADFTTPACQQANVQAGQLTTITGTYVSNPGAPGETGKGELRVTTNPALPAQILIDGVLRDSWGLNWLKLAPGNYTLSFTHVEGYTEPAPQQVTITNGQTTTVNANFTQRGSLRVITNPAVDGTISVDGVPRNNWGMWTDIPTGNHQVCFGPVQGLTPPACQNANVTAGQLTTITGVYT